VKAARTAVWSYLAESERRAAWWPGLQLEAGVGGTIAVHGGAESGTAADEREAEGAVDVWVEGHAVGFTWREAGEERGTAVLMTLRSQGRETGVTITETGFDALAAPAERAAAAQRGWQGLLAELTAAIEAAGGAEPAEDADVPVEDPDADRADAGDESADPAGATVEPSADTATDTGTEADTDTDADTTEQGSEESDASASGALEISPEAVDGEVDDSEGSDVEIVEVEAEPQVGDHLELDTGSVQVLEAVDLPAAVEHGTSENDSAENDTSENDTVEIQRLVEAEKPVEPDFDTLIRGA
jgi:uncharacterized protein YndB with AHSA1/START domain